MPLSIISRITQKFILPALFFFVFFFGYFANAQVNPVTFPETPEIVGEDFCKEEKGNNIQYSKKLGASECVELLANQSIDLVGDFNTYSGTSFDARIGNAVAETDVYAIPEYGVGVTAMDYTGKNTRSFINLELTQDPDGNLILKDLAYDSNIHSFDDYGDIKKYLFGLGDMNAHDQTTFTKLQMKDGVNVNSYRGRELTVTVFLTTDKTPWNGSNPAQQTIFIPDSDFSSSKVKGKQKYYYAPEHRFYKETNLTYFEEYLSKINLTEGDLVINLAITNSERENPVSHTLNISGPTSPDIAHSARFLMDDFVHSINSGGINHPVAYQVDENGNLDISSWVRWFDAALLANQNDMLAFKNNTLNAFASYYTNDFGFKYKTIFVNNELWGYWTTSGEKGRIFMDWVREGYKRHSEVTGNDLMPWQKKMYNSNTAISNLGMTEPKTVIEGTYQNLTYESNGSFENFINNDGLFGDFSSPHGLEWGASINDMGDYLYTLFNYEFIYDIMYHGMLFEKHNFPKKNVFVTWNILEPTWGEFKQSNNWIRFKGDVYRVSNKQIVPAQVMFAAGATTAFFVEPGKGGICVWSEPWLWGDKEESESIYPQFGTMRKLTKNGEVDEVIKGGAIQYPSKPINFINQLLDGYSIVKENNHILENTKVVIADVKINGNWVSGADKYPHAASYYKNPLVAYRKLGNEILVYAYAYYNHKEIEVTFRTEDGSEYEVELKGSYPTIVKITN